MILHRMWSRTSELRARLQNSLTHGLAGFGVLALVLILSDRFPSGFAIDAAKASVAAPEEIVETKLERMDTRQQRLAQHLSRRYRVAPEMVRGMVNDAYAVGQQMGIDPLLILAVVAVESRFNPIAESGFGAKGLMQVVPRFHLDKLAGHGGIDTVLEARTNIAVGTQILKEYVRRTGSLEAGLQMYAGAADDESFGYSQKVLTERDRLHGVLAGASTATKV
ncbi:MAG TPA: transglycosylase SLT domain-containing protein [Burkholderiales bacterium]|nr:transglycosylase SLT domain-containing protein [Burkholderiales bacterium]